jgi:hypothetical protein
MEPILVSSEEARSQTVGEIMRKLSASPAKEESHEGRISSADRVNVRSFPCLLPLC